MFVNRPNMVDALVEDVENWDVDTLIGFTKETMRKLYNKMSTQEIEKECNFYLEDGWRDK